tara:strand:+ start:704 stop:898 length:195 start_codon:yes stop_codon:yes gene_type:complete
MSGDYLHAYQPFVVDSEKIKYTRISKVSYLLKLKAQRNSISDLDKKHKAWGQNEVILKKNTILE